VAITRKKIEEAVDKFLPRTMNFSQSEDLGEKDIDAIFSRIMQILSVALVTDADAVFEVIKSATDRMGATATDVVGQLDALQSQDYLKSIQSDTASLITDFTQLELASSKLTNISGSIRGGSFGTVYAEGFQAALTAFIEDELQGNVAGRNQDAVDEDIRAKMAELKTSWDLLVTQKSDVLGILTDYAAVDLKSKVAGDMVAAVRLRIEEIQTALTAATKDEQAAMSESVLLDLSAAQACLQVVQDAPAYMGTARLTPDVKTDGATSRDYLFSRGEGRTEPVLPILKGSTGKLYIDNVMASKTGTSVTDGHTSPAGTVSTANRTSWFEDSAETFDTGVILPNMFLTLVATGKTYRIKTVTSSRLTVFPRLKVGLSATYYVVTARVPGTYFHNLGAMEDGGGNSVTDFWTEYTTGTTGTAITASGSGNFVRDSKESGTDGKNAKDSGAVGVTWPKKADAADGAVLGNGDGVFGQILVDWEGNDVSTTPGINVPNNHDEACVFTDTVLTTAYGEWRKLDVAGEYRNLETELLVEVGMWMWFKSKNTANEAASGATSSHRIVQVLDPGEASAVLQYAFYLSDTWENLNWASVEDWAYTEMQADIIRVDRFTSATATFTATASPGDKIWVQRGSTEGELTIVSVISDTEVAVEIPADVTEIIGYPTVKVRSTMNWELRKASSSEASTFIAASATFITDGILAGDVLHVESGAQTGAYSIELVSSETEIWVTPNFTETESSLTWTVRRADAEYWFEDNTATFLTSGVTAGDLLVIDTGAEAGTYTVDEVGSEDAVKVIEVFGSTTASNDWKIPLGSTIFQSASASFLSNGVVAGEHVLDIPTITGTPFTIASVDSQSQITISGSFIVGERNFDSKTYDVYPTGDVTYIFYGGVVDFDALGAAAIIDGRPGLLDVLGTQHPIVRVDPDDVTRLYLLDDGSDPVAPSGVPIGQAWDLLSGTTTVKFADTTASPFGGFDEGDQLVISPGASEERLSLDVITNNSLVDLSGETVADRTGLTYAVIDDVRAGQELLTEGRRSTVISVEKIDSEVALLVEPTLPVTFGINQTWYLVNPGMSPLTKKLTDLTAAFDSTYVGKDIQLHVEPPLRTQIRGVESATVLYVESAAEVGRKNVAYRVLSFEEGLADTFRSTGSFATTTTSDYLTVWGEDPVFEITAVTDDAIKISPYINASLTGQLFCVANGGSINYGRYLLLDYKMDQVTLDADTDTLRLHVADALINFGNNVESRASGTNATVVEDGDEDSKSPLFRTTDAVTFTTSADVGDRLTIIFTDATTATVYVTEVIGAKDLKCAPEMPQTTITSWELERNSISYALKEAARLLVEAQSLQDISEAFTVAANGVVDKVVDILAEFGMDRAIRLLKDGKVTDFFSMTGSDSTSSGAAKNAVQDAGGTTTPTESPADVSGTAVSTSGDVLTEEEAAADAAAADASTDGSQAQSDSGETIPLDSEIYVALSRGVANLVADERVRRVAQISWEELRNRAIYELVGETESGLVIDTADPTLPWIAKIGSLKDRTIRDADAMIDALDYIINNPDDFDEITP
jgi:hypothetical protein